MDFRKSEWLDGWYFLENATAFGIPEGRKEDWEELVQAVQTETDYHSKRLAARKSSDGYKIYSPRNAHGEDDYYLVKTDDIEEFCSHVMEILKQG